MPHPTQMSAGDTGLLVIDVLLHFFVTALQSRFTRHFLTFSSGNCNTGVLHPCDWQRPWASSQIPRLQSLSCNPMLP